MAKCPNCGEGRLVPAKSVPPFEACGHCNFKRQRRNGFPNLSMMADADRYYSKESADDELSDAVRMFDVLSAFADELGDDIVYRRGKRFYFGVDNDSVTAEVEITKEQAEAIERRLSVVL